MSGDSPVTSRGVWKENVGAVTAQQYVMGGEICREGWKHNVVMKVLKNTIGKKIHTLVKENTLCIHKIRLVSFKRPHFSLCYCVFFPTVMQILVGRLDSYLLTHTKNYMTPIHALIFEKHVKMCVYARHVKKPV